jgi:hypothetical protein
LITIAGSIIVVIGQLAGTIIPIMFGPEDISDFSISANPTYIYFNKSPGLDSLVRNAAVKIEDFHPYIRPYRYYIYLNIIEKPNEVVATVLSPVKIKTGEVSNLKIFYRSEGNIYSLPITIQGIGEDGKTHNMTIYLSAYPFKDPPF